MNRSIGIGTVLCLGVALVATGMGQTSTGAAKGTVVLNNDSQIRAFLVFQTPMVLTPDGTLRKAMDPAAKQPKPLPDYQSVLPPPNWFTADFDDSAWDRRNAPIEMHPGHATGGRQTARHTATANSMICARARLVVNDPDRAGKLKLTLEYVGGAVLYLNGQEIARGHMPAGKLTAATPAEKYPDDLYCRTDGSFLQDPKKNAAGFQRRYRKLEAVLPRNRLKKGSNVLAFEIHRAPINEGAIKAERKPTGGMRSVPGIWAYTAFKSIQLTAASPAAVVAATRRPGGAQVWNVAPFETIDVFSFGDPGETLQPVTIHAARNGTFSGRLAVSSGQAIRGLEVTAADLKRSDGSDILPASTIRIRYAEPATRRTSWVPPYRFDGLVDAIPAEVLVNKARPPRGASKTRTSGAVASLWFTVQPPANTAPGLYEGTVMLQAEGLSPTRVPLRVHVSGWKVPDAADFVQHHLICTSPESVARHYGAPLWSEKHLAMMGKSLALLAGINSREVAVNLAVDFYGTESNGETLVRWIRQPDGTYRHDFSVFDKYLDLVAKHVGKPFPLRLNCWGELGRNGKNASATKVSLLDPATGKIEAVPQPLFGSEESYAFWKPVIDEALKRLKARGWLDVTAFGHNSYCYPVKPQIVDVAYRLWPEGVWAYTAHNGKLGMKFKGEQKGASMPVKWALCVWTEGKLRHRGYQALLQPRPSTWCTLARTRHYDRSPLIMIRNLPEEAIERGQDGLGDFGAENFPIEHPQRKGRYFNLGAGRGTGGGNNASTRALLAAGPNGPVSSQRFEMFREGVQLSEAILYLQRALAQRKIRGALAQKVNACLDRRSRMFNAWHRRGVRGIGFHNDWSIAGQFENDARLLALAGEVAAVVSQR